MPILQFQEKKESQFCPMKLKFTVKSHIIKDKIKAVNSGLGKTSGFLESNNLPFYQVFDDVAAQQVLVEYLKKVAGLTAKPPKQEQLPEDLDDHTKIRVLFMLIMLI